MFREILEKVKNNAEGVISVCISGSDGIPVEVVENGASGLSAEVVTAEMTNILRSVNEFFESIEGGAPEEIVIRTQKYTVLVRLITSDYFALALLDDKGNLGKARFLLRKAVEEAKKEF